MVKNETIAIIFLVACVIVIGSILYVSLSYEPVVEYPGVEYLEYPKIKRAPFEDITPQDTPHDFRVVISYHADKIYEGAEIKVSVLDRNTEKVVEGANVSFMMPEINHLIPEEGYVYFYAPRIQDEYLLHQNDTSRTFPITVKKEGYNTYHKTIEVHLA